MAETFTETVTGIGAGVGAVTQVRDALWDPLMETIATSNDMATIHRALSDAMTTLSAKRDDYEEILQRERATKRPSKTYNNWIQRVTRIEKEVEEMKITYEAQSQRSPWLWLLTRSNFSQEMKSKSLEVVKLLVEGRELGNVLVEKEPECVVNMIAPDIKEFPTLQKPMQQILDFLSTDGFCIGINGMVGIGKTTIMLNLNNHEKVAELFKIVIWIKVSTEEKGKNLSLEQMQQAIVRRLKLNMDSVISTGHVDEVAHRIREELKEKKYLLLLDDVKEDLELDRIGIHPNNENGSKIVFTSRLGHVCHSIVDKVIKVGKLTPKEAWKMFQIVLGHSKVRDNPNIERLMYQVVKFCDGLPFVIKMVGSAFKMRDTEERWSDGFDNLREWPEKGDYEMSEMHKLLSFCCECLEGAQKDCFLYCAMYPEDSDIHSDCLLDCWAAEDLYEIDDDARQVRAYGRNILDHLKKVSLLEEGRCREYVRMHKLIRKAALYSLLVDHEHKHMVKTGESLEEPTIMEHWAQKKWISLVDSKLKTLPEAPECSMLSTLFLQKNPSLNIIPHFFFENMGNLRVLDFYRTGIASLPSSVSKLKLLKVLYLNCCTNLVELPSQIGEIENLEVLDIRGSGVVNIPSNFERLRHLRRLLVSFNNFGSEDDIQSVLNYCNVISKISTLEVLVVDVKSYKERCSKLINVVRDTVGGSLTKLTTLKFCFEDDVEDVIEVMNDTSKIHFPKADDLTSFVEQIDNSDSESRSFHIFIGCSISSPPQIPKFYRYQRYLKYYSGEGCYPPICKVLAIADAFELINHNDLDHVTKFGNASLMGVKCCLIESCNKISRIVDGSSSTESLILPNLERLYINKLPELRSIWRGHLQLWSLSKLKTLEIRECIGIVELIVEFGNGQVYQHILPNLRKLVLVDVPSLRRICSNLSLEWPTLEKLKIHGCPNLKKLPFNKENATRLRSIEGEQSWWEALHWQDQEVKNYFQLRCSLS